MQAHKHLLSLFVVAALAACGDAPRIESASIRDSAGISIIENGDPRFVDSLSWSVDTTRAVRIGKVDGEKPYLFSHIAGIVRLSDGRIVVADQQSSELRFFRADGAHDTTVGRRGPGPGEFGYIAQLFRSPGDSLLVQDGNSGFVHLDARGREIRRFTLKVERPGQCADCTGTTPRLLFGDGTVLVTDASSACGDASDVGGVCADSSRFFRATTASERVSDYGMRVEYRLDYVKGTPYVFADAIAEPTWAVAGDRFYFGDPATFEVMVFAPSGKVERIIRAALPLAAPPTELPLPSYLAQEPATPAARARRPEHLRAAVQRTRSPSLPAYERILVDRAGNLWVKEYTPYWQSDTKNARWWVFDSTGVLRHAVRLPALAFAPPFSPVAQPRTGEIGDDYIIGVAKNADGVEAVVFLPLIKRKQ